VIAHVAGFPVEELIPMVAGAGSMLLLARGWAAVRVYRILTATRSKSG
jgi:hypothetical protein